MRVILLCFTSMTCYFSCVGTKQLKAGLWHTVRKNVMSLSQPEVLTQKLEHLLPLQTPSGSPER